MLRSLFLAVFFGLSSLLSAQYAFQSIDYQKHRPLAAPATCNDWTFTQLELALQSLWHREPDKALALAESAFNGEPDCPQTWQVRAKALFELGQRALALQVLDSAILTFKAFPELVGTKGQLLMDISNQGRLSKDNRFYEFPGPDSLFRQACLKEAQNCFSYVLAQFPEDEATAELLAMIYRDLEDYPPMVPLLEPFVKKADFPELLEARWLLGQAYLKLEESQKAIHLLRPWVRSKTLHPGISLSSIYRAYGKAWENVNPDSAQFFQNLAVFSSFVPETLGLEFNTQNYTLLKTLLETEDNKRFAFLRKEIRREADTLQTQWMVLATLILPSDPEMNFSGWLLAHMEQCWPYLEKIAESRDDQIERISQIARLGGAARHPGFVSWATQELKVWSACCLWSPMPDFLPALKMADPLGTLDLCLELWDRPSTLRRNALEETLAGYSYEDIRQAAQRQDLSTDKLNLLMERLGGTNKP